MASYQRQVAAQERQVALAEKAKAASALVEAFQAILNLHRAEFVPASPPVAGVPAAPDRSAILRHYQTVALDKVGIFEWRGRKEAKQRAASWAETEVQRQWAEAVQRQAELQKYYDHRWQQLCSNDTHVVIETLNEAFEDNEAPSAAVNVDGSEVVLVVLLPPISGAVPEQLPTMTQAGNLSFKKLTQRDRADYYKIFVSGHVLVTLRETFAVAPGLQSARVVALRNEGPDAYGRPGATCLLAGHFERTALDGVQWADADAVRIVNDISSELLINQSGRSSELAPLDLSKEPQLQELIQTVDFSELADSA